jgi:ubiquinone/menaquinone biosynthesis C-methylase UbiE
MQDLPTTGPPTPTGGASIFSAPVWSSYKVELIPSTTQVASELLQGLPVLRNVVDIGCGTGGGVAALAQIASDSIIGVDVNREAIHRAHVRTTGLHGAGFLAADANGLPFEDNTFDLAIAQALFTVIPTRAERGAIVEQVRRVVQPGGFFYVGDFLQDLTSPRYRQRYEVGYELTGEYGTFPVEDAAGGIAYFAHHFAEDELVEHVENFGFFVIKSAITSLKTYSGHKIRGMSLVAQLKI